MSYICKFPRAMGRTGKYVFKCLEYIKSEFRELKPKFVFPKNPESRAIDNITVQLSATFLYSFILVYNCCTEFKLALDPVLNRFRAVCKAGIDIVRSDYPHVRARLERFLRSAAKPATSILTVAPVVTCK